MSLANLEQIRRYAENGSKLSQVFRQKSSLYYKLEFWPTT